MAAAPSRTARKPLAGALAPFKVRSFRFQWPADFLSSWAFEMENLILGWYVLSATGSVLFLTLFGALQYFGTLLAPLFGVAGDRIGRRQTFCTMRAFMCVVACTIMTLGFAGLLRPTLVLPCAFLTGLVRPSDMVLRNALIGDTMPKGMLMNALGLSRMTMDSARIVGALAGAGLFAALGIARAYMFVAAFYGLSFLLTMGVSGANPRDWADAHAHAQPPKNAFASHWRDLRDGIVYSWKTPAANGLMLLAVLVNFMGFPLTFNLMPYVAREVYGMDATGLSHLVAGLGFGTLTGSILMALRGGEENSGRFMTVSLLCWFVGIVVFAHLGSKSAAIPVLFLTGMAHSFGMIAMSGVLLRAVSDRFRARVMGIRMLCVYALPFGLLLTGPLIERVGYPATASLYVALGIVGTGLIAWRWRDVLWRR
jgi:predicted MFS family arabinose efflux permease